MTAGKRAAPAKAPARTVRSAKPTGTAKAGSPDVTAKPTRPAPATAKVAKSAHTNNSAATSTARSANSAAKPAARPAPRSVATASRPAAKKAEKATKAAKATKTPAAKTVDHPKPPAKPPASSAKSASNKKVAPAKKAAASVNSTTTSNSITADLPAKKAAAGPYAKEPKFLEEQRALLAEERGIYQGQAEDLQAEADSLAQEREPGDVQFDEESGEGGTVTVDRERDLALSAQALLAVEEIDDAERKIDRKTYGACERCHEAIPKARLRRAALCPPVCGVQERGTVATLTGEVGSETAARDPGAAAGPIWPSLRPSPRSWWWSTS